MDTKSGFHRAGRQAGNPPAVISPHLLGQEGPTVDGRNVSDSGLFPVMVTGDGGVDESVESTIEDVVEEPIDESRHPRLPHNPGRPTKNDIAEHCVSHWPFRSWCCHCVCGRAAGSPHKSRSEADRDFSRSRVPTISMDRCFL